jgi:Ice-binding-like
MLSKTPSQPPHSPAPGRGVRTSGLLAVAWLVAMASLVGGALAAQAPVGLGTADSFAVLAGSTVTNTGPSTVNGDLGLSPGTAVTGFPPGTVNGTIHAADAVAGQAQTDLTTAYNDAAGRTPPASVSGDLAGLTLAPGVYKSASSLGLSGALTLDAQGDPNAVFVFQAGSTLTTASGSHVNLINGAQSCNVFWQIGSSATLGTSSVFTGNILALTSISINNGVTVNGRALARNGAVTLNKDTITPAHCAAVSPPAVPPPTVPPPTVPPTGAQNGTALFTTTPRSVARTVARFGTGRCVPTTFRAVVTGLFIRQVVFSLGKHVISIRSKSPFEALVRAGNGIHTVSARVTFTDSTPARTLSLRFRSCAAAKRTIPRHQPPSPSQPERSPIGFTG